MQKRNIIHRDLKPDNILLNSNAKGHYDVRIADFGFALRNPGRDNLLNCFICGTPGYIPPEVLRGKDYNLKSDIFSVGSILFNILTGKMLFCGSTPQ